MARTFEEEERIKRLTALQASMPQWLSMQSTGASTLGDMFGLDTETIKQFGETQEKALEGFRYKRPERLLETKQPVEWWKERAALNSMNTVVPMFGFAVGNLMKAMPHPLAKVIGSGIHWGTMAMTYNTNFADTLEEHEQIAGRELTPSEKQKAALVSIGVSALDLLAPIKGAKATSNLIAKTFGKGGVQNTRNVLQKLVKTNRDSLLKQVGKGASFSGKLIATEMGTEAGQKALQMGTSVDPGKIGTSEGMQDILEEAVIAGPTVGIVGAPGAVGVAREQNRDISTAQRLAKQFNRDLLRKESPDNTTKAKGLIDIPENDSDFKKLAKQGNAFIKKVTGVDVKEIGETTVRGAAFKPLAPIIKLRNEATTGAEFHAANNLYQMFAPTGTYSGEQKTGDNFFSVKETKTGEYLGRVTDILNKYATTFAMTGNFGKRFDPDVNDYLIQAIKGEPITANLPTHINKSEIDADVRFIKSILAKAHKDLKSSGVAIGWVENYLTNPVSKDAVRNNVEGFVKVLMEASKRGWEKSFAAGPAKTQWKPYTEAEARRIADEIVNGIDPNILTAREALKIVEDREAMKKPGFEKSRSAAWEFVDEVAEEMGLGSFREQNVERVITEYLQKAATRVASAQTFGDNASLLEKELKTLVKAGNLTLEQRNKVYDVYDAAHNVYKRDTSKNVLAASKVATTVGAATHLALATISSITELAWVGERAGFSHMLRTIPKALRYSLEGARKGFPRKYVPRGEMQIAMATLGFNIDPRVNERLDQIFATDHNAVLNAWFRSPLGGFLTQWTNFNRNWAAQAMISNINSRANARIKGNISDVEKGRLDSELKENGISYEEFDAIVSKFRGADGVVRVDITNDTILDEVLRTDTVLVRPEQKGKKAKKAKYTDRDITVRDKLIPWLHKVVDDVVVHPKATNKPLWMSDPKLAIIAQLKTFPIVFGNTVVKRLLRKLNPKQCSPDYGAAIGAVGGIAMAYGLVHIGETMKAAIRQTDFEAPGMRETLDRAGLTGAFGLVAGAGRFHQGAVTSLGGTAIGAVDRAWKDIITPMYTGVPEEKMEAFPNLIDWLAESADGALGPIGIYFKPFEGGE